MLLGGGGKSVGRLDDAIYRLFGRKNSARVRSVQQALLSPLLISGVHGFAHAIGVDRITSPG
jgi:hypothetical protein